MSDFKLEKRSNLSLNEFIEEYRERNLPVVFTDAAQKWGATEKWTPSYLKENFGHKTVKIDVQEYNFGEFIDMALNSTDEDPAPYLRECDITEVFPELMADITPIFKYTAPNRLMHPFIFNMFRQSGMKAGFPELLFGGTGGQFPRLHFDNWYVHAFVTQVYGDKEFTVYPPDQGEYLYPIKNRHNISELTEFINPDPNKYPLYKHATPYRIVVKQGETIFVPGGWWHVTKMLTPSIAVSYNSITRENWQAFRKDVKRIMQQRKGKPLMGQALSTYLAATGPLLNATGY